MPKYEMTITFAPSGRTYRADESISDLEHNQVDEDTTSYGIKLKTYCKTHGCGTDRREYQEETLAADSQLRAGGLRRFLTSVSLASLSLLFATSSSATEPASQRVYPLRLVPIQDPKPLLADHPEFVQPICETARYEASILVNDNDADLSVRAWRTQFNVRGIIELPNRLRASRTAVIVVHPWGINDGQGWQVPEPAGFAFGTPAGIRNTERHLKQVVNPFLKTIRGKAGLIMYSLPRSEGPIRKKLYRSFNHRPTAEERQSGQIELTAKLKSFTYKRGSLPKQLMISTENPVRDYFRQFNGGMFGNYYNGSGYWDLPIPVHSPIDVDPDDVVIYDGDGYEALRTFLKKEGISHVLLCGYSCSKCYRSTTAGYLNLCNDFNVFLIGDATLEMKLMVDTTRAATAGELAEVSRENLITQISWIVPDQ